MPGDGILISVVIPAYNAERFVADAIASAISQSHDTIEVIVVDDGSTDNTAGIVEKIAAGDARVRLVRTGARGGAAKARNHGVRLAKGELVAPLDSDDLWAPDKLERQLEALREGGPEVGVVYCWTSAIDEAGRVLAPLWRPRCETGDVLGLAIVDGLIGNASVPLIRRRVLDEVGGYCESLQLGEDWDFHMRAAAVTRFGLVKAPLVGYRLWPGGATSLGDWRAELARMTARVEEMWPEAHQALKRDRAYKVEIFLAFLAIRRRRFLDAASSLLRAGAAQPRRIFSRDTLDILSLYAGHLIGLRRYAWRAPPGRAFL